jgi:hypothetical protein
LNGGKAIVTGIRHRDSRSMKSESRCDANVDCGDASRQTIVLTRRVERGFGRYQ